MCLPVVEHPKPCGINLDSPERKPQVGGRGNRICVGLRFTVREKGRAKRRGAGREKEKKEDRRGKEKTGERRGTEGEGKRSGKEGERKGERKEGGGRGKGKDGGKKEDRRGQEKKGERRGKEGEKKKGDGKGGGRLMHTERSASHLGAASHV